MNNTDTIREIGLELGECNGCTACSEEYPGIFEWDDSNDMPVVNRSKVGEEEIRDIMSCCPGSCIVFVDDD